MKLLKNKSFKLIFLLSVVFIGCSEDKFLEEINPNAITTDTFWQTDRQFNSALTTVYGALQFQNISGGELQYEFVLGDICGTESWYRPQAFRNLAFNASIYHVTDKWNQLYIGVFRANQVIEYIQQVDPSIFTNAEAKSQIEAQARFLRAFFYWQIAHTYGGAVIHDKVAQTDEELSKPFSTIAEVNEVIIVPDLEFAQANLPLTWDGNDIGRATSGAAASLLGKVYLYDQDWAKAASQFKTVIDSDVYSLPRTLSENLPHEHDLNS